MMIHCKSYESSMQAKHVCALTTAEGVQWPSGTVLDLRLRGRRFEPYRCHCVVVLEQDTFILA